MFAPRARGVLCMIFRKVLLVRWVLLAVMAALGAAHTAGALAEDGYQLWLRYTPIAGAARDTYAASATNIVALGKQPLVLMLFSFIDLSNS